MQHAQAWAQAEFGRAELGDPRRTKRFVRMATSLAESPGKIVEVFRSNAEQQGAYDLLANEDVRAESMLDAVRSATAQRCANHPWVHVVARIPVKPPIPARNSNVCPTCDQCLGLNGATPDCSTTDIGTCPPRQLRVRGDYGRRDVSRSG